MTTHKDLVDALRVAHRAIKKAPHHDDCYIPIAKNFIEEGEWSYRRVFEQECDCWKKKALSKISPILNELEVEK